MCDDAVALGPVTSPLSAVVATLLVHRRWSLSRGTMAARTRPAPSFDSVSPAATGTSSSTTSVESGKLPTACELKFTTAVAEMGRCLRRVPVSCHVSGGGVGVRSCLHSTHCCKVPGCCASALWPQRGWLWHGRQCSTVRHRHASMRPSRHCRRQQCPLARWLQRCRPSQ